MVFERSELRTLIEELDEAYGTFEEFAILPGYAIDVHMGNLPSPGNQKTVRIHGTVVKANNEGWLDKLLEQIARDDKMRDKASLLDEVARLRTEIETARAAATASGSNDPLAALTIDRLPFFNRGQLRRALGQNPMSHVFIISGAPASGKTYSWRMIKKLARLREARLIKINLEDLVHANCEPAQIMQVIAARIGLDTEDMPDERFAQNDRVGYFLTNWFIGQAQAFEEDWWIGIDGLDKPGCGQGAANLVGRIARSIDEGELSRVRLFILGTSERYPLPTAVEEVFETETTHGIDRSDVRQHLRDVVKWRNVDFTSEALDILVESIFDGLPQPIDHEHMPIFKERYKLQAEGAIEQAVEAMNGGAVQ